MGSEPKRQRSETWSEKHNSTIGSVHLKYHVHLTKHYNQVLGMIASANLTLSICSTYLCDLPLPSQTCSCTFKMETERLTTQSLKDSNQIMYLQAYTSPAPECSYSHLSGPSRGFLLFFTDRSALFWISSNVCDHWNGSRANLQLSICQYYEVA